MSDLLILLFLLLIIVGLLGSAFYSGMETGLYTINRVRLTVRAGHGDARAAWLQRLIRRPILMLTVLLLGNNIANYASSFGITGLLDHVGISPVSAIFINAAILIPLLFIFAEVLPKELWRTQTDRWSYQGTPLLRTTSRLLTIIGLVPLVACIAKLIGSDPSTVVNSSKTRLGQLLKEGVGAGVLSESQTTLLDRAMAMRELSVTGEMVPWSQVRTLAADLSGEVRLDVLKGHNHTRLPVVEHDGRVIGVVSVLDVLLNPDTSTRSMLTPPLQLPGTMPVPAALEALRTNERILAIVTDDGGHPQGVVTMKDLVEVLTGELEAW
ncbi:MAG: CNNM domain-containing protein [Phycisphaerales bacterium]|nr:CNNM domain-containing protein [Phycisphaerales bacterium]